MESFIRVIRESMVAVVVFFFEALPNWYVSTRNAANKAASDFIENLDDDLADELAGLEPFKGQGASIKAQLEKIKALPFPLGFGLTLWVMVFLMLSSLKTWFRGVDNLQGQVVNAELEPNLMSMEALAPLLVKYPQLRPQIDALYDKWGIPEDQRGMLHLAQQSLPNVGEILTLVNREELTYDEGIELMARQGFSGDDAISLMELRKWIPSPQDVVYLAGREAFEEDQIKEFDLDKDMPPGMFEWTRKAGLSDQIARMYWIAHWQNPSLNQVFTMIHREAKRPNGQPFGVEDLDIFYRLADVQPFFGDLLRQIAYRPLTRVDVRRMFRMNVLNYDQVKTSYKHLGYDEDNARLMADFAVQEREETGKNLTRGQLEKLYRLGLLEAQPLVDQLVAIGYDDDEARDLVDLVDADMDEERFSKIIRRIEWEYKRQILDVDQARSQLAGLQMQGLRVNQTIDEWNAEEVIETTLPSKEDLLGWYGTGVIDPEQFRKMMRAKQYNDDIIELYAQGTGTIPSKTDLLRQFDRDVIDEARAREGLEALGYSERDRDAFVRQIELVKERRAEFARS